MSRHPSGPVSVSAPAPPSLENVLRLAGFHGVVVVERLDGQPMTPQQADLARGIVELHEEEFSNEEISQAVLQVLKKKQAHEGDHDPSAATGTASE
jgi:hypothetical protein